MAVRFLALVQQRERGHGLAERTGSRLRTLSPPMRVKTHDQLTIAVCGDPELEFAGGTILGPLFDRRYPRPVATIDEAEARCIVDSRGQHLIERYWGGYVAILFGNDGETSILRAPFGELPCYRLVLEDAIICASDVGLLIETGLLQPGLAWNAVIREIAWRDVRGSETCLSGVEGLRGGERLTIADRTSRLEPVWSPWDFVAAGSELPMAELADKVRRAVWNCVAARASSFDHVLLMLSGGLDSSIVAACLARGGTPFSLATMTTRDPLGDERGYAACTAQAVGHPLHEALREVARIDPDRSTAAHLPRPAGRLFEQESARIAREVAALTAARAIITGGGGDNVFCSLQSAAPVADRVLVEGPGRSAFDTACEIARIAPASLPAVLWAALGRLSKRNRGSHLVPDLTFLASGTRSAVGKPPHPWLATPRGALPGKAAHIMLLAAAESFAQGVDPQADLPTITPLLGQPLIETCVAIPSWCWFVDARNRAVARRAFAGELPDEIAGRSSKGTPDSFAAEIYERYRLVLRERLLGGLLAAERILDTAALDQAFANAGALAPANYRRLLRLADVETWARAWAARAG